LYLESLYLKNFRNYREINISFSQGVNLILGVNGEGKTNLIEAIYMLSTSKSFRSATDNKIKQWETGCYNVIGQFSNENNDFEISIEYSEEKKHLSINGIPEKKISNIIGHVYCVLYFFEDIYLITGPPYLRRNFLDLILSTVDPLYFRRLRVYLNVLRQKNKYLKDNIRIDRDLLFTWNDQLIENGSYIIEKRVLLIRFINSFIDISLEEIGDLLFPFRLFYKSNIGSLKEKESLSDIKGVFGEKLIKNAEHEINLRQSVYGPHRDDFLFMDSKFEMRYFGSVGEARLSSIILKQAQAAYYAKIKNVTPIHLIDDILLELDMKNTEKVLKLLNKEGQKIITTTERIKLPEIFSCDLVFHITNKGNISWKKAGTFTE
jgi:DNA replication and repair protein RecF